MTKRFAAALTCLCLAVTAPAQLMRAQQAPALDRVLNALTFRNIGPFRTAAWVTAVDVPETPLHDHLYTIYAASRSGGLWKTTNAGTTWTQRDRQHRRRSDRRGRDRALESQHRLDRRRATRRTRDRRYSGKGVFKSTDAGATWQFMGLPDSHHIARIVIHPTNPDIVYVAAMGHLFSKNDERGVFRTTDGGKTWKKVLYVNDGVGAIDLVINRKTPTTLYAAMYDKDRQPWQIVESGPESGDLPDQRRRRQVAAARRRTADRQDRPHRPRHLPEEPARPLRAGREPESEAGRRRRDDVSADQPARRRASSATRCTAPTTAARRWRKVTDVNVAGGKAPYSFNQIRIDPHDDQTVIVTSDSMFISRDGGKTWSVGLLPRRVRRLPRDVVGPGGPGPHDPRQRRRRQRLGRRRPHRRLLPQHGRRRSLRGRRGHGRSLQRLRRPAGPRLLEGPEQRPDRARSRSRTG